MLAPQVVQRTDQRDLREHRDRQTHQQDQLFAREVEACDCVCGRASKDHRDRGRDQRDPDRVAKRVGEDARAEDLRVVRQRPLVWNKASVGCRRGGLERQEHDPQHRDKRSDQDDCQRSGPSNRALGVLTHEAAAPAGAGVRPTTGCRNAHFALPGLAAAPKTPDEEERDQSDEQEQQHRDRRAEPEIEPIKQRRVVEHRDRLRSLGALVEDVDHVEDPELVERAEQQRDEDRRLHQRQRDADETLPGAGAVDLRRFVQVVRDERKPRQQAAAP